MAENALDRKAASLGDRFLGSAAGRRPARAAPKGRLLCVPGHAAAPRMVHVDRKEPSWIIENLDTTRSSEPTAIDHFLAEGLITDVLRIVKTGKEASVHLCRANRSTTGEDLLALKAYHPLDRRDFRDESIYRDGEWIKERRIRAALEKHTRFGRVVQGGIWVGREWETLRALSEAGLPVPRPIASTEDAILMTYLGDEEISAPQLRSFRPDADEAGTCSNRYSARSSTCCTAT